MEEIYENKTIEKKINMCILKPNSILSFLQVKAENI